MDSAARRARRKLLAEAYSSLPSRETLAAAADLERAKAQRAIQDEQFALQRGSLAVAVLSQVPRGQRGESSTLCGGTQLAT